MINEECAICFYLQTSLEPLKRLSNCIGLTTGAKKQKFDFGLYLSAVTNTISQLEKLQHYHREYHLNGEKNPVKSSSNAGYSGPDLLGWEFDEPEAEIKAKKSKKKFKPKR